MKKQENYNIDKKVTWINCNGEFKHIDETSFASRVKYKLKQSGRDFIDFKNDFLYGQYPDKSAIRAFLIGFGIFALCQTDSIAGYIFATAIFATGMTMLKNDPKKQDNAPQDQNTPTQIKKNEFQDLRYKGK